ncbi:MAG: ATP-binding cassette domain-containing protein [Gemmatimonadaceae bacterium]|nr:ATP-binding cassette domain-containing protein [Gemmatimonadaceae bacterium]
MSALLEIRDLVVEYASHGGRSRAVDGAALDVLRGETLALVGESGSGKTSLGRAILRLVPTVSGSVRFGGDDVLTLAGDALRHFRRRAQVVFQDPKASLDPRMRVRDIVREGIDIHALASRADGTRRVERLLEEVGLSAADADRLPHEFSGGERQRIAIARALAVEPEFLVLDEAVSALDVLVRRQVLDLLAALQAARGLTYLFIAHDLAVVERIATRVAVMQQGRIVECAPTAALFAAPASGAAQALLAAIPRIPW